MITRTLQCVSFADYEKLFLSFLGNTDMKPKWTVFYNYLHWLEWYHHTINISSNILVPRIGYKYVCMFVCVYVLYVCVYVCMYACVYCKIYHPRNYIPRTTAFRLSPLRLEIRYWDHNEKCKFGFLCQFRTYHAGWARF